MPLRANIAALALVFSSTVAGAGTVAYTEALATLYRFDLTTRTAQEIGTAGSVIGISNAYIDGLTFGADGKLYGVSRGLKALFQINQATGAATLIGSLGIAGQGVGQNDALDMSMAFTCDGKLWLASGTTNKFWQVNPFTGATTYVGSLGATITGLAAKGTQLFGTGSQTSPGLYSIDTATAKTSLIGSFGANVPWISYASPGFDAAGQLWAILDNVPPHGNDPIPVWSELAQLDSNGTLDDLGAITGPAGLQKLGMKGLAIAPVNCTSGGGTTADSLASAPVMSERGIIALILLMLLGAGTSLRRRHPNR